MKTQCNIRSLNRDWTADWYANGHAKCLFEGKVMKQLNYQNIHE